MPMQPIANLTPNNFLTELPQGRNLDFNEDLEGLEETADRYQLLLLVKKVGKLAGFTPRMISLLDYYLAYTRDVDWEEGSRPIVYQSLSKTALDLGVSERQIQKLEAALFEVGAIRFNDSGNHRRYGQRDNETGRLLWAFGVELTPLAYLRPVLESKLHEKELYDQAWQETKRKISWHRRQIRAAIQLVSEEGEPSRKLAELLQDWNFEYEAIAVQIRTHIKLPELRLLLDRHKKLYSLITEQMGAGVPENSKAFVCASLPKRTRNRSPISVPKFTHYKSTTQLKNKSCSPEDNGFQESVVEPPPPEQPTSSLVIEHITLKMALSVAGQPIKDRLPLREPNWNDLIEAAYSARTELGISQSSWGRACQTMGRAGAAVCLMVTERATVRPENRVRQPAAYFAGMVKKAEQGELRLYRSVFGLLNE